LGGAASVVVERDGSLQNGGRGSGVGGGRNPSGRGRGQEQGRGTQTLPTTVTSGKNFTQNTGYSMAQAQAHFADGIPNHYVLLDSDSTVSIFNNAAMLVDIHEVDTPLVLESNGGGHQVTYQMGIIPDFGKVWFNENSIANILSLADVRKARRVDSPDDSAFHVHKLDGSGYTRFEEHPSGLYLHNSTKPVVPYTEQCDSNPVGYSYLQTVAENKKLFTKRQIESADCVLPTDR
jgi:hypothetical protein